jgi:hypothetical protein
MAPMLAGGQKPRWAALFYLMLSSPGLAQQSPPPSPAAAPTAGAKPPRPGEGIPPVPDVVVEARRVTDRKAIHRFVSEITAPKVGQIARFHEPICPKVVGIASEYGDLIRRRIIEIARKVGIPVDQSSHCVTNFAVVLTPDVTGFIHDARKSGSGWFGGMEPAEIDGLERSTAPVRVWSTTSLRNESGRQEGAEGALYTHTASLIDTVTTQYIDASFVIFNREATYGLTLRQLADYAAMRGLAQTQVPTTASGMTTILGLFETTANSHPPEMTRTDMIYLQALYKEKGFVKGIFERNRIAAELARPQ